MRLHRFYVSQPLGEDVVIKDVSVINQWSKVFRYKEGDFVILFNGDSSEYYFCIRSLKNKECTLKLEKTTPSFIPTKKINLYLSVIKKDNFELVVQKCTELGVHKIIPVLAEHSEKKSLNMERLRTIAIEASEQCGRGDVPIIDDILTLRDAFARRDVSLSHIVTDTDGTNYRDHKEILEPTRLALWVGPEGGWGTADKKVFETGETKTVTFGTTVLRAETAGIVLSGLYLLA
jgi:16S rRNA (uracil1498-N3)-methyltransferase